MKRVELTKALAAIALGILLLAQPVLVAAGAPEDQDRQSVDKILAILADPRLKQEGKKNERREKLKKVIYQRFDFTEMARRSLGPEWRRRNREEQKEFVKLFTDLLYLNEREGPSHAEVDTKIIDNKGREFSVKYRLHSVNGDWKV
jgi:phospholipid transport system substrate-binding protein